MQARQAFWIGWVVLAGAVRPAAAQRLAPVGPEFTVNSAATGYQLFPSVAVAPDGGFMVVWSGEPEDSGTRGESIWGRQFSASGAPLGPEFLVNTYTAGRQLDASVVAGPGGQFLATWYSESGFPGIDDSWSIEAQRFDAGGARVGGEFIVNSYTPSYQTRPSAVYGPDGGFTVAWTSIGSPGADQGVSVQAQRFAPDGSHVGTQFRVNTSTQASAAPELAAEPSGRFVAVWATSVPVGDEVSTHRFFGQHFDAQGKPVSGEFAVQPPTSQVDRDQDVAIDPAGNVLVVWDRNVDGTTDVHGRFFDAAGSPLGPEMRINSFTEYHQEDPAVAVDAAGNFLVVWAGFGGDDAQNPSGIFAQLFDGTGAKIGGEMRISAPGGACCHGWPDVAANARGNFVVTWNPQQGAGADTDVVARRLAFPVLPAGGSASQPLMVTERDRAVELAFRVAAPSVPAGCQVTVEAQPPAGPAFSFPMTTQLQVQTLEQPQPGAWTITARSDQGCPDLAYFLTVRTIPLTGTRPPWLLALLPGAAAAVLLGRRPRAGTP